MVSYGSGVLGYVGILKSAGMMSDDGSDDEVSSESGNLLSLLVNSNMEDSGIANYTEIIHTKYPSIYW